MTTKNANRLGFGSFLPAFLRFALLIREISGFSYYLDWRHLVVYLAHFEVISLLLRLG